MPPDKIVARIPRAMANIGRAIPLCHEVFVLDNSSDTDPCRPVFTIIDAHLRYYSMPLPDWAGHLLSLEFAPTKMAKPGPVVIQPVTAGGMPAFKVAGDPASITPDMVREANEDQ